jgi:hypothetical protein
VYAQAADLFGADPDETADLDRDWHAARRSHQPNAWQRIRRPFNRGLEARRANAEGSAA